ncbi:hypothetical protein B0H12DRAFT_1234689 [Mycena haematopus]|nr:hypothetical protein B0H12DRAFT_1234689 [Mycena haematopus]
MAATLTSKYILALKTLFEFELITEKQTRREHRDPVQQISAIETSSTLTTFSTYLANVLDALYRQLSTPYSAARSSPYIDSLADALIIHRNMKPSFELKIRDPRLLRTRVLVKDDPWTVLVYDLQRRIAPTEAFRHPCIVIKSIDPQLTALALALAFDSSSRDTHCPVIHMYGTMPEYELLLAVVVSRKAVVFPKSVFLVLQTFPEFPAFVPVAFNVTDKGC